MTSLKDAVKKQLFGGKIKFRSELEKKVEVKSEAEEVHLEPVVEEEEKKEKEDVA